MGHSRGVSLLAVPFAVVLSVAGAHGQTLPSAKSVSASVGTPATVASDAALHASSEPFEALTETAFDASWPALDKTIAHAIAAAATIRSSLSPAEASRLDAELSAIRAARGKQDRAGLALSSIEGYRVLVSATSADAGVPAGVSLLDYAGFRYDADLKARPLRWDDMGLTVAFARQTADALAPRMPSSALVARVDTVILAMGQATTNRNAALAASTAQSLLDLVDQIEETFASQTR